MKLAKKYGGSNYATFRRYVITNPNGCCVVVLEEPVYTEDDEFSHAEVRRVVASTSFEKMYDCKLLAKTVTDAHPVRGAVPGKGKRMSFQREVLLTDRNGDERVCNAEAFNTGHQTLILIKDVAARTSSGILLPGTALKRVAGRF
jgi:hypothetical protein